MARFLLLAALILALPATALADDGGMAAPGGNTGDVAAPSEPAPVPVEEPPVDPTLGDDVVPPGDIGPYGPNHQPAPPVATDPAVTPAGAADGTAVTAEVAHEWPHAQTRAAEVVSPGELVGAGGPGASGQVAGPDPLESWLFAAMIFGFLFAVAAALVTIWNTARAARQRASVRSRHTFA